MTVSPNTALTQMRENIEKVTQPPSYVARPAIAKIDPDALYRLAELKPFLPISCSTWRRLVAKKEAPTPIKLSAKCTLWRGSEILDWLRNPDSYEA